MPNEQNDSHEVRVNETRSSSYLTPETAAVLAEETRKYSDRVPLLGLFVYGTNGPVFETHRLEMQTYLAALPEADRAEVQANLESWSRLFQDPQSPLTQHLRDQFIASQPGIDLNDQAIQRKTSHTVATRLGGIRGIFRQLHDAGISDLWSLRHAHTDQLVRQALLGGRSLGKEKVPFVLAAVPPRTAA